MMAVLLAILGFMAGFMIAMFRDIQKLRTVCDKLTTVHQSEARLFELTNTRLKKLELAQQEQLDRIVNLTAAVAQNHGDLKRWTYQNVNDIWYAIENPMTGKEEESEEVRS